MCHYITHYDLPELEAVYMSGLAPISPDDDIQELFGSHRRLSRWWAFLWGAYADRDEIREAEAAPSAEKERAITIGRLPERLDEAQLSIAESSCISVDGRLSEAE